MIHAPFNFVPLSEKVFFPDWADNVSHDIPFKDGISGEIDITITAKSPMFIRNHNCKEKSSNKEEFCSYNDQYYIPGTSVKGMIRNVIETMSFSKMNFVDDDTYAVRDLNHTSMYTGKFRVGHVFCGWLSRNENGYVLEDCGLPGWIKHVHIDKITEKIFAEQFRLGTFNGKNESEKTAEYKYDIIGDKFPLYTFDCQKDKYGKNMCIKGNSKKGHIVVTGQASARKDTGEARDAKGSEFVFFTENNIIHKYSNEEFDPIIKNFKFAYFDSRKTQPKESTDWGYWKKKFYGGERIPIFFKKENNVVTSIGLSYLYKLPYTNSIHDALPDEHLDNRKDLAETMFGYIEEKKSTEKTGLKGRVQFSHFKADSHPPKYGEINTVLGKPRASYYPQYIQQSSSINGQLDPNCDYMTLMDDEVKLAGRKRYPLHNTASRPPVKNKNDDSVVTFNPLGVYKNNEFEEFNFNGKVRYHNLKPEELGALVSALTFHVNQNDFYHNIGMAKSYGFGKIKLDVDIHQKNIVPALKAYERMMDQWSEIELKESWLDTDVMKELFAMSHRNLNLDSQLKYLILDPVKSIDEFRKKKSSDEYLPKFTKIYKNFNDFPASLLKEETWIKIENIEKDKQRLREEEQNQIEEKKRLASLVPTKKVFLVTLKQYIESRTKLPYYEYKFFNNYMQEQYDDIPKDFIDEFESLWDDNDFNTISTLYEKKNKNTATDAELGQLHELLKNNTKG